MTIPLSDLTTQLQRQLTFLRNSAEAYDAGDVVEAVRIGVVIRVLCHDTGNSVSLLQHFGQKQTLKLVSTAKTLPQHLQVDIDFAELMTGMTFGTELAYAAVPAGSPTVVCPDWWTQPVFLRDRVMYARKDIVLSAANKDGGAHVDAPDAKLQAFQESFWTRTEITADGAETSVPLANNHFRMLRRFADELLNSQELLALAA